MNLMVTRTKPSAMMLRWLTLGAAAGAALTMSLDALGLDGPWQGVALVLALLALFASIGVFVSARNREREIEDARSEEHTSELQSLMRISYAVFCLKKKNKYYTEYEIYNITDESGDH